MLEHRLGRHVRCSVVEGLRIVEVPADGRREDVGAPLVVGDGEGLLIRWGPAEVQLRDSRAGAARALKIEPYEVAQRLRLRTALRPYRYARC